MFHSYTWSIKLGIHFEGKFNFDFFRSNYACCITVHNSKLIFKQSCENWIFITLMICNIARWELQSQLYTYKELFIKNCTWEKKRKKKMCLHLWFWYNFPTTLSASIISRDVLWVVKFALKLFALTRFFNWY